MPTVKQNKQEFDGKYQWIHRGDEWSSAWGGPSMQWYGAILPRIHSFVPNECILEIACGYGRWTRFLKGMCNNLIGIDLSEECVSACRERFSDESHLEFHANDGKSLDMIADSSVGFVFTFDSLVHADASVLEAYLAQLPRILTDDGTAFIHHSNLGEYQEKYRRIRRIPKLEGLLKRMGFLDQKLHWRDSSVSAPLIETLAREHGLSCISQEILPWGTKRAHIDCFSILAKDSSPIAGSNRVLRNPRFMQEAANLKRLSELYARKRE